MRLMGHPALCLHNLIPIPNTQLGKVHLIAGSRGTERDSSLAKSHSPNAHLSPKPMSPPLPQCKTNVRNKSILLITTQVSLNHLPSNFT